MTAQEDVNALHWVDLPRVPSLLIVRLSWILESILSACYFDCFAAANAEFDGRWPI